MVWKTAFHPVFYQEFQLLSEQVQDSILAKALFLQQMGPQLGRPHVDTLSGSKHSNMKELRVDTERGVWRIAFAFDTTRKAVLLVAGDKSGTGQKRFYKAFIHKADERFDNHLKNIKKTP